MKKYTEKVIVKCPEENFVRPIDRNVIWNLSNYAREILGDKRPPPPEQLLRIPNVDTNATEEILQYLEAIHSHDRSRNQSNPPFVRFGGKTFLDKVVLLEVMLVLKIRPKVTPKLLRQDINARIANDPYHPLNPREIRFLWEGLAHHRKRVQGNLDTEHLDPTPMLEHLATNLGKRRALRRQWGQPAESGLENYLTSQPELKGMVDAKTQKELNYSTRQAKISWW